MGNIISFLRVSLGLDNSKFKAGLKKTEKETKSFGKSIGKVGTAIKAAIGAAAVAVVGKFILSITKLAGEAEGVEKAFNRIADSNTLRELQSATRGTVNNLELMRKAVMAQNLGVPVKELADLFEFASQRAADTGESVDYLVSSIVTGIGRKSPLILDNLGISAIALKEKLDGVGLGTATVADVTRAVASIANDEMKKAGDTTATTGQTIQSLTAAWDNVRLSLGKVVTSSSFLFKLVSGIALQLNSINVDKFERNFLNLTSQIDEEVSKISNKDIDIQVSKQSEKRLELLRTALKNTQGNIDTFNQEVLRLQKRHNARGLDDAKKTLEEERAFAQKIRQQISTERDKQETSDLVKRFDIYNKGISELENIEKSFSSFSTGEMKRRADLLLPLIKQQIELRKKESGTITELKKELETLESQRDNLTGKALINTNNRISAINKEIDALKNLKYEIGSIKPVKIDVSSQVTGAVQGVQLPKDQEIKLPLKITTEGTFAESDAFIATQQYYQSQLNETQGALDQTSQAASAYGSILGSVGQIAATSGDQQMSTMLNVASTVLQTVGQIIAAKSAEATAGIAAGAAQAPWFLAPAVLASGLAMISSVFAGLGASTSSGGGSSVTSIDTRGFTSPTTSDGNTRVSTQRQSVSVEVVGTIKGRDIALANNQGQKQLKK